MPSPRLPLPPNIRIETLEDASPEHPTGFLRLVRRRCIAHYPDATQSQPFLYDEVDRVALDAVVIVAHHVQDGERHVYLRSAVRPPIVLRGRGEPNGLWELPAGLVETGEQGLQGPVEAACRELEEEIGFRVPAEAMRALGPDVYPAPAIIGEKHSFFEVEVNPLERREPSLDGSALEHLGAVIRVPLGMALECCKTGEICDSKTELGLRRLRDRME